MVKTPLIILIVVLLLITVTVLSICDIRGNNHPVNTYIFDVTYVNGDRMKVIKKLPSNFTWYINSNRGSYFLSIWVPGRNIWGNNSITGEWDNTAGVLYINSITKK